MKKLLAVFLVCLILVACGTVERDSEKEDRRPTTEETESAHTRPALEDPGTVTFERKVEEGLEYGLITWCDSQGQQLWQVETDRYEMAMLDRVGEIGRYGDLYFYLDDGAVVALSLLDRAELWRNEEFQGAPTDNCAFVDEDGTIFLSGFLGPDLFVVDVTGKTLLLESQANEEYYWPCRLEVDREAGIARVYMTGGPEGDMGSANAVPVEIELP